MAEVRLRSAELSLPAEPSQTGQPPADLLRCRCRSSPADVRGLSPEQQSFGRREITHGACFKRLSFRGVCYTARADRYNSKASALSSLPGNHAVSQEERPGNGAQPRSQEKEKMDLVRLQLSLPHVPSGFTPFVLLGTPIMVGNHLIHSSRGMPWLYLGAWKITTEEA